MDREGVLAGPTLESALYWRQIYSEMLEMEEKVLARIDLLMDTQSEVVKREVELANVPVVVAQAERFRQLLGYWATGRLALPNSTSGAHSRVSATHLKRRAAGYRLWAGKIRLPAAAAAHRRR
jgi:hypothetical protein